MTTALTVLVGLVLGAMAEDEILLPQAQRADHRLVRDAAECQHHDPGLRALQRRRQPGWRL